MASTCIRWSSARYAGCAGSSTSTRRARRCVRMAGALSRSGVPRGARGFRIHAIVRAGSARASSRARTQCASGSRNLHVVRAALARAGCADRNRDRPRTRVGARPARVKAIVALKLGRVSNLPTVWTNAVAGTLLAGASPADVRLPALLMSMSLCYVAGMFLNDAFDRGFDARYRPERPIPAGEVSAVMVFVMGFAMLATGVLLLAWTGYSVAQGTRSLPVACGAALAAAIVLYDWHHKQNPISPLLMGLCRWLIYVTAGFVFARTPPAQVFTVGALLLCYLIGLTYIAKQEHLGRIANLWPLAFIAI